MTDFYWDSAAVATALLCIPGVKRVLNTGPGGDVDSDCFTITVKGATDRLFVSGFSVDSEIANPDSTTVEFIELKDGLDSRGGLNSSDPRVAMVYTRVRQYFVDKGAVVVPTHKDYF